MTDPAEVFILIPVNDLGGARVFGSMESLLSHLRTELTPSPKSSVPRTVAEASVSGIESGALEVPVYLVDGGVVRHYHSFQYVRRTVTP